MRWREELRGTVRRALRSGGGRAAGRRDQAEGRPRGLRLGVSPSERRREERTKQDLAEAGAGAGSGAPGARPKGLGAVPGAEPAGRGCIK